MTTRADFIITVADQLGISEVGQELSTEDGLKVGRYVNIACNELRGQGNIDIDPSNEIPDNVEISLAQFCAFKAASAYNMNPQVLLQKFNLQPATGEQELIGKISAAINGKPSFEVLPIQPF